MHVETTNVSPQKDRLQQTTTIILKYLKSCYIGRRIFLFEANQGQLMVQLIECQGVYLWVQSIVIVAQVALKEVVSFPNTSNPRRRQITTSQALERTLVIFISFDFFYFEKYLTFKEGFKCTTNTCTSALSHQLLTFCYIWFILFNVTDLLLIFFLHCEGVIYRHDTLALNTSVCIS